MIVNRQQTEAKITNKIIMKLLILMVLTKPDPKQSVKLLPMIKNRWFTNLKLIKIETYIFISFIIEFYKLLHYTFN